MDNNRKMRIRVVGKCWKVHAVVAIIGCDEFVLCGRSRTVRKLFGK